MKYITKIISCVALCMLVLPSTASVYTVRDIHVQTEGLSPDKAREDALKKAKQSAFRTFLTLVTPRSQSMEIILDDDQVSSLIRHFSLSDEKFTSDKYRATYAFEFDRDQVRNLLNKNNIPFTEEEGKRLVVIPSLLLNGHPILWDDENLWKEIWTKHKSDPHRLVKVIAPLGDAEDQSTINKYDVLERNKDALLKLANHYKADDVLLATVDIFPEHPSLLDDPIGPILHPKTLKDHSHKNIKYKVSIRFTPYALGDPQRELEFIPQALQNTEIPKVLEEAVQQIHSGLNEEWKMLKVRDFGKWMDLDLNFFIRNLQEWRQGLTLLRSVPLMKAVMIKRLSTTRAVLKLQYYGYLDELRAALESSGFMVDKFEDKEIWARLKNNAA